MPDLARRSLGRWGEDRAAAHYRAQGYAIVDRNWRSPSREVAGELDVVARRADLVVFCEVKTRRSSGYGGAALAVDGIKRERIRRLASAWLVAHRVVDVDVRFDVIVVEGVRLTQFDAAF
jgi:putative endonuclease